MRVNCLAFNFPAPPTFHVPSPRPPINSRMNAVIDAIYREQSFLAPTGETIKPFPVAIKRSEGEALYHLVRKIKPAATLEVGTAHGLSAMFICQALRDNANDAQNDTPAPSPRPPCRGCTVGHHTAIDPYQSRFKNLGLYNIQRAGLSDLLTFHEEPSQTVLARFVTEKKSFDLIFIDGSHLFDSVFVDFYFADQLIPVGGLLIFDDLWMPAIRKTLRFILKNRHYQIAEEFMGDRPAFLARHVQNLKYQTRKKLKGKPNLGTGTEMTFHKGRNINWCILQKTAADDREWDHFAPF